MKYKYTNLQVGDNDLIGNKFNGYELHRAFRARGVDSSHLVWNKESKDKNTYVIAGEKSDRPAIRAYTEYIQHLYDLDNIHNPLIYDIIYNKLFLDADIVHLHLMHNGLWDLNLLPFMSKLKPIVWSVHDMWIATGSKTAKNRQDYYFPPLTGVQNLELNWEIKKEAIKNSNVRFIVASKYMEQAMNDYPLFRQKGVTYIPYSLDFNVFYPRNNSTTRKELGLNLNDKLILARGSGGVRKGLHYIEHVMKVLGEKHRLHFLIVGENEINIPPGTKTTSYTWLRDDELMAKLYSVADIFLMPSTREYFGMMAVESMACGTLPIVLDGTSLPEAVNAPDYGISTPQVMRSYADAVEYYLNESADKTNREEKGITYVRAKHSIEKNLQTISKLYDEVIRVHSKDQKYQKLIEKIRTINGINPSLKPSSPQIPSNPDKYQEKNLFFEKTTAPLKVEIAKLRAENRLLKEDSKKLLEIYSSKRWRYITRLANIKNKVIER